MKAIYIGFRKKWRTWTLPSKLTAVSFLIGLLSFFYTVSSDVVNSLPRKAGAQPQSGMSLATQQLYGQGTSKGGAEIRCECENGIAECTAQGPEYDRGALYPPSSLFARDVATLLSFHEKTYGSDALQNVVIYGLADGFDKISDSAHSGLAQVPQDCAKSETITSGIQELAEARACIVGTTVRTLVSLDLAGKAEIWELRTLLGSPDPAVAIAQRRGGTRVVSITRVGICA